jgi:hypothetical protein
LVKALTSKITLLSWEGQETACIETIIIQFKMISTSLQRESNTSAGFVNFFERHIKLWMNGRVRSMNPQLDWALMRYDMSHIGVTDTSPLVRDDYAMHGLHLNPQGKKRLTQLIAERVVGGHASGISSISVIIHARASSF